LARTNQRTGLDLGQTIERTLRRVETERQDGGLVVRLESTDAGEGLELADVADRHRHVAPRAPYREVVVVAVLARQSRQIELDPGERELERDPTVFYRALALDRQRRARHRHSHVHGREAVVGGRRCHGDACRAIETDARLYIFVSGAGTVSLIVNKWTNQGGLVGVDHRDRRWARWRRSVTGALTCSSARSSPSAIETTNTSTV